MSGSDMDYTLARFGPTEAEVEDAADRAQDDLAREDARLARDTAFIAWLKEERRWHGWGTLVVDMGQAQARVEREEGDAGPRSYMRPFADLARAESWAYVLRTVADVMEGEKP